MFYTLQSKKVCKTRRLTYIFVAAVTALTLTACGGDSGTGPDETTTYTVDVSAAEGGSVSPSGTNDYQEGETVELTAENNDGYVFAGWTGDLGNSDNPLSLTVDQDYSLTANFEKKSYALTTNSDGKGVIAEEIVQQKATDYEHGTVVELTAAPNSGYSFVEWQGDLTGTDNPAQITVDTPKEVTAVFKESFYLASNGVTIKCEVAGVGEAGTVNGNTYTKRSVDQITTGNAATTCTSGITDMSSLFSGASSFNGDISHWDVSAVTNMSKMFYEARLFDQDLNSWDVSGVTNMSQMFGGQDDKLFNGDISGWDVSNVTDMSEMFYDTNDFNQDISGWDVSGVTDMSGMFWGSSFNQDISGWDVSNVTQMDSLFMYANAFNQDIGDWDVSSVTNMYRMFAYAGEFNQDIGGWDVSNVTDMSRMFYYAEFFNQDISGWDVSGVTDMSGMFRSTPFNQDISGWDVSSVTDMSEMFSFASSFNWDISGWDVSNVTDMSRMFAHTDAFDQDIGGWDVSGVTDMFRMFYYAESFDQDISTWCVEQIASEPSSFDYRAGFDTNDGTNDTADEDKQPVWGTCPSS